MADFATAWAPIRQYEGGYSNDSADRGGETYCGISRVYFPRWAGWPIVDEYKKTLGHNPATLTKSLALVPSLQKHVEDWYRQEWWDRLGLVYMPQSLANEVFEQSVNLGKAGCGKKLQTICNAYNRAANGKQLFPDLKIDGAIGPKTLAALACLLKDKTDAASLVHACNCMQGAHYIELAAKKPSQRIFINGWMRRTHCEAVGEE